MFQPVFLSLSVFILPQSIVLGSHALTREYSFRREFNPFYTEPLFDNNLNSVFPPGEGFYAPPSKSVRWNDWANEYPRETSRRYRADKENGFLEPDNFSPFAYDKAGSFSKQYAENYNTVHDNGHKTDKSYWHTRIVPDASASDSDSVENSVKTIKHYPAKATSPLSSENGCNEEEDNCVKHEDKKPALPSRKLERPFWNKLHHWLMPRPVKTKGTGPDHVTPTVHQSQSEEAADKIAHDNSKAPAISLPTVDFDNITKHIHFWTILISTAVSSILTYCLSMRRIRSNEQMKRETCRPTPTMQKTNVGVQHVNSDPVDHDVPKVTSNTCHSGKSQISLHPCVPSAVLYEDRTDELGIITEGANLLLEKLLRQESELIRLMTSSQSDRIAIVKWIRTIHAYLCHYRAVRPTAARTGDQTAKQPIPADDPFMGGIAEDDQNECVDATVDDEDSCDEADQRTMTAEYETEVSKERTSELLHPGITRSDAGDVLPEVLGKEMIGKKVTHVTATRSAPEMEASISRQTVERLCRDVDEGSLIGTQDQCGMKTSQCRHIPRCRAKQNVRMLFTTSGQ